MTPRHRLRSPVDYRRVLRAGSSVTRPEFLMYYAARGGTDRPRFGFVVSRRIGPAVARNRVKRLLREAARPLVSRLTTPADVVVVARQPIVRATVADLRDALAEGAGRAGLTR